MNLHRVIADPLAPVVFFSAALAATFCTYMIAGVAPPAVFEGVASFGWTLLLVTWMVDDALRRKGTPCFDFGLLCWVGMPLSVPWYCFWSRGWRELFTLTGLIGLWLFPYLCSFIVWKILYGSA
jgi:hypothetical protein